MKHNLFLSMLVAAFLGSGVANAETLYASDYTGGSFSVGSKADYDKVVVNVPLTLTGNTYLDLYENATIEFHADNSGAICSIFTSEEREDPTVYFEGHSTFNFAFDAGAQAIVAASTGKAITLIQDKNMESMGFLVPDGITLTLNGKEVGETVSMGGVEFTYVGAKATDYVFKAGEIGFTGYESRSHNLNLIAKAPAVPEPTTGSLSLLALAGLCARRRRK